MRTLVSLWMAETVIELAKAAADRSESDARAALFIAFHTSRLVVLAQRQAQARREVEQRRAASHSKAEHARNE